jgi:AhpD family alkylhydroperoxidase
VKKYVSFMALILIFIVGVVWVMTSEEGKIFKIRRRIYCNFGQFWKDTSFVIENRKKIALIMKGNLISPAFRERLMLSVTAVNNCRICSYVHTKQALLSGLSKEETEMLLKGVIDNCPDKEIAALFYAQHWADTDANPDPKAKQKLVETYGKDTAEVIELVLRVIRVGNLVGNTWDYSLYRFSFSRWDPTERNRYLKNENTL